MSMMGWSRPLDVNPTTEQYDLYASTAPVIQVGKQGLTISSARQPPTLSWGKCQSIDTRRVSN